MIRTCRALRAEDRLAAVVDLRQIAAHGEGADASRWFYSLAHRITRELRLRVELQSWWQDRSAISPEQRFADFFADVVLTNTSVPVTILIDEVEQVAGLSFAAEFFAVIRNCYTMRASEPDYARLNFAVFGVASPTQLCPDRNISPFLNGEAILLEDFTVNECYRLEPGFGLASEAAFGLIDRIYAWTNGQPYLTQKLARAVARRGGRLEDVERSVHDLFLSPNAAEEPMLSRIRRMLTTRRPAMRAALLTLRNLVRGADVQSDPASLAQEILVLSGVARHDPAGRLVIGNRIFRQAFTEQWIKSSMPFNWRGTAVAAGIGVLLVLVPYWYINYLPRPYVDVLTQSNVDFEAASTAYSRMHRLPGFGERADELYARVLSERSRGSESLAEVLETDALVRTLSDRDALADSLLGEFWLRRSARAVDAEDRDAALLYAATAMPVMPDAAHRRVAALVGEDYRRLERTAHLRSTPLSMGFDWSEHLLGVVADDLSARSIPLRDSAAPGLGAGAEVELTALQHEPFVREQSVDSEGSAGSFDLELIMEHAVAADLTATLAAPSGAAVTVELSDELRSENGFHIGGRALAALADEPRQGVWRLTIVDGQAGNVGVLHRWSLVFSDVRETWLGAPQLGVPIPDPVRTRDVAVDISRNGRFVLARPSRAGATGSLAIWDLHSGELRHDFRLDRQPTFVEFTRDGEHLVVVSDNELLIWATATGEQTARIETQTAFLIAPALSVEGSYVTIAEEVEGSPPLFSLIRVEDGQNVRSIEGVDGVMSWSLGPEARYLALVTDERSIEIIDPRTGALLATLDLERAPRRIVPVPTSDLIVTIDSSGDVHVWRLAAAPQGLELVEDWRAGRTYDPASVSVAADGSTLAFAISPVNFVVVDVARQRAPLSIRVERSDGALRSVLAADGSTLLTANGTVVRLWQIGGRPLAVRSEFDLSALTISADGRIAALGFRGGHVRAQSLATLGEGALETETVDFIGHRGPVTAIALSVIDNLIATGGDDGVVRTWNLATMTPSDRLFRHGSEAITTVALAPSAEWMLSGSEGSAQLWNIETGQRVSEYAVNGVVTDARFAAGDDRFAIGDSTGNVFVASVGAVEPSHAFRADSAIRSVAWSPSGDYVVSGDALGNVRVWPLTATAVAPPPIELRQAVRWVSFATEQELLVQTEAWFHRITIGESGLAIAMSRLLPPGLEPGAVATEDGRLRFAGGVDLGRIVIADLALSVDDVEAPESMVDDPWLVRDWGQVLGYVINDEGHAVRITR